MMAAWTFLIFLGGVLALGTAQVLTPPYFNLAEGRRITATATCGVDVEEPELYCKLVGANSDKPIDFNVIQGQLCDICDPTNPQKMYPPENAIDGSERWWQSPPISRGLDYNEVNITIDLGQLFQVAYVVIKMANSPRPGIWALERSVDNGETYDPWQYFADSTTDCKHFFGSETLKRIENDDDVICTTKFSKVVPLEGGEIFVSLLNDRPSAEDFFNSSTLQEFTRATNVRLRLVRTKTLLGHLMSVERQDSTITRRYFYSIKDISIGGRCVCNGHARVCDIADPDDKYQLQCRCQHNTCGAQCESCCPGFIQKKWRPASYTENFVCEPCNCFGHSDECIYDAQVDAENGSLDIYGQYQGGGVCQNCHHNTVGTNCHECAAEFYKPFEKNLNDTDVCQPCQCEGQFYTGSCDDGNGLCECRIEYLPPYCDACNDGYYDYPNCKPCDCHRDGTVDRVCEVGGGQCPCKDNFRGLNCEQCAPGYFNFSQCTSCECSSPGSLDSVCDINSGQCKCQSNYGGLKCERCEHGYYGLDRDCEFCNCDSRGTVDEICDKQYGDCLCKEGYSGARCDNSAPGFWGYPLVQECDCHVSGSSSKVCDSSGKCACLNGYSGRACDQCSLGFYKFPFCEPCNCDQAGSNGITCDDEGRCQCKYNFDGTICNKCKDQFYNFPLCEECNCDPAGVLETFAGCGNAPVGELCECKERVTGRICNQCKSLYWNLREDSFYGCDDCSCFTPGTVGGLETCDSISGQCNCKPHVNERRCDVCVDGTYNLIEDDIFGCTDCQCNIGGSVNHKMCDKVDGQCTCRHRIDGQKCDRPMTTHYFPTLYQHKYEIEDGQTPQYTPVRYGFDEQIFADYSWRGYAVYSELQKETIHDIYMQNPSLYRLNFNYMNPSNQIVKGKVVITPENPLDSKQEMDVNFEPTNGPALMTVSTLNGFPLAFVINSGTWSVSIEILHSLFIDYMVFLPQAYYEATLLEERITNPRLVQDSSEKNLQYAYTNTFEYDTAYGTAAYVDINGSRTNALLYRNEEKLRVLNSAPMAIIGGLTDEIRFDIRLKRPGKHVILLNYFTPESARATSVFVQAGTRIEDSTRNISPDEANTGGFSGRQEGQGRAVLYDCTYAWTCRQVVANLDGEIAVFDFEEDYGTVLISTRGGNMQEFAIESVTAIPYDDWHLDHVTPKPICIMSNDGKCIVTGFSPIPDATKIEFESNTQKVPVKAPGDFFEEELSNSTRFVHINSTGPTTDISGRLKSPGNYVFVVHYYQPNHPGMEMDVLIENGQLYEGLLLLEFCPSVSGCRSVITDLDRSSSEFNIFEDFNLNLKQPKGLSVWLDYVLIIPREVFLKKRDQILNENPLKNSAKFLGMCAKNHFNIDTRQTGFCRESVFALTTAYNNGAFPCQCNFQGSISFECELFGGQCPCKTNVIGRECNQCKTGYFGFPDCKPCGCPSTALCDPMTGECICPPRVEGERCEKCAPNTYGFDPLLGCEECKCNQIGVVDGQLQCNLSTGQCQCKNNVMSRKCEQCTPGYWSFPQCRLCNCDLRGTESDICNQNDATCYCKMNTEGASCDVCTSGTYYLDEENPDGCSKCFCFGKSQFCSSSNLYWNLIGLVENGWKASKIQFTESSSYPTTLESGPEAYPNLIYLDLNRTEFFEPEKNGYVYFALPESYYGNMITSYGGTMRYKVLSVSYQAEITMTGHGDVVLHGKNITALYFYTKPLVQGIMNPVQFELNERNFRTTEGVPMKREQFMQLLNKLDGIYIRAQYATNSTQARLSDLEIEVATQEYEIDSQRALSVEQCQCPPNYSGTSCESCAEGYYRTLTGPYGGYCVPCKCNNHADTCDPVTGQCIGCRDNTIGFNCEKCAGGYFGDASKGTPYDCLICSCPLPSVTNNFALSCSLTENEEDVQCVCKEGYTGPRCDICSPGYYGEPTVIGEYCKRCECNNNIDVSDRYACDDISGLCLSCLNNTYGEHCERCSPGYFGDAILLKNCQDCSCDECGTRECDHYSGVCECHPSVIGDRCHECAPEYWGFASCQGCHSCSCDVASESRQCDIETGQCPCRFGVTGQRCDRCKPGFWSYTEYGCTECTCRAGFSIGVGCDPQTGQCSCLPGVIGDNCEGCPDRWALIEGYGCQECTECVHALLDTTDDMEREIRPVIQEFESAAQSFFLHKRLQVINDSVATLGPFVQKLEINDEKMEPVKTAFEQLFSDTIANTTKAKLLNIRAEGAALEGFETETQAMEVIDSIYDVKDHVKNVVMEIDSLALGLEVGAGAKIEQAIQEAEYIVEEMKNRGDFLEQSEKVRLDFEVANEFFDRIKNMSFTGVNNEEKTDDAMFTLDDLQEKIKDMEIKIDESNKNVFDVHRTNEEYTKRGLDQLKVKLSDIKLSAEDTSALLQNAENFSLTTREKFTELEDNFYLLDAELIAIENANNRLNETVNNDVEVVYEAQGSLDQAIEHANALRRTANELDDLLSATRYNTENALKAANADKDIVEAIRDAENYTNQATVDSDLAVNLSRGTSESSQLALRDAEEKYNLAESQKFKVDADLLPKLNNAQYDVDNLNSMNNEDAEKLESINSQLDNLDTSLSKKNDLQNLQTEAENVDAEAEALNLDVEMQYEYLEKNLETAQKSREHIENAERYNKLAHEEVAKLDTSLPKMQNQASDLLVKKGGMSQRLKNIGDSLEKIRQTIAKTREKTNKIKVGIEFEQGSFVEVKNPPDLSDTATAMELSMFLRTNERLGLPLFLGTPADGSKKMHRTSTDDFVAIEINEGYPQLTINLGAGTQMIRNNKFVADNEWHKIMVKRIGKVIKFSVYTEDEKPVEVDHELSGTFSILNLDPKVSKLYVGGIPAGIDVEDTLMSTYYNGHIEELMINKRPTGLWNFVKRSPADFPLKGSKERLVLKDLKADSHVLRFDGTGYTKVTTKGHKTTPEISVVMDFKTFAEDGLMFLVENGENEFVSVQLNGGKLVYQHKFDDNTVRLESDKIYNDNNWHTLEATRVGNNAIIKIDGSDVKQSPSSGQVSDFSEVPKSMFFGGYPGRNLFQDVISDDFRGCIKDVRVSEVTVDFAKTKESIGTVPGCEEQAVNLVSYHEEYPGYVKLNTKPDDGLQLVFKFKSTSPDGLLFYTETSDRKVYLSLTLSNGALELRSSPGGVLTTGEHTKYNDSQWHIVIATRENDQLRLDIDDFENFRTDIISDNVRFDGPAFFGGLPEYFTLSADASATNKNFIGCIGDATLNGDIINFALAPKEDRPGAMLETCSLVKRGGVEVPLPRLVPVPEDEDSVSPIKIYETTNYATISTTTIQALSTERIDEPLDRCALPVTPEVDPAMAPENSLRFGAQRDSRIEYSELPDNIRGDFQFSLEFRSQGLHGVIFYAHSISHRDFVTIYMNEGKIVFSFNPGSTPAIMRSLQLYNNDEWHKLVAHRTGNSGRLEIDGYIVANGSVPGQTKHIDHQSPYYFGGIDSDDMIELTSGNTEGTFLPFNGCLRNFRMNNKLVDGDKKSVAVRPCSHKVELGLFFGEGDKSHAVARLGFVVGSTFEMTLEIKPRKIDGVLMSVHGKRDFLLLQLRNGTVELKVDNGKGIIVAKFDMTDQFAICDGRWHTIKVIKNKHVIVLTVAGVSAPPASGPLGSSSADTNKPLFLGSQFRLSKRRGNAVKEKYVGCMRNLVLNKIYIDFRYIMLVGNVTAGVCPTI